MADFLLDHQTLASSVSPEKSSSITPGVTSPVNRTVIVSGGAETTCVGFLHGPGWKPSSTIDLHGPDQVPVNVCVPVMPFGKL